ncbi:hypothetical protein PAXINDRAFT_157343 [Paxillus involutus ATCC 200175]|uniref:Uncharacterized protein n=1 Tax=Paxillus involutus ATCC 200175 TaxID=664439 RepID=A0A0C9TL05_PAXIN|nr:hypothetical protein PAXINDRAFT_157343 [Paxillus involutus ATCC 200175]
MTSSSNGTWVKWVGTAVVSRAAMATTTTSTWNTRRQLQTHHTPNRPIRGHGGDFGIPFARLHHHHMYQNDDHMRSPELTDSTSTTRCSTNSMPQRNAAHTQRKMGKHSCETSLGCCLEARRRSSGGAKPFGALQDAL